MGEHTDATPKSNPGTEASRPAQSEPTTRHPQKAPSYDRCPVTLAGQADPLGGKTPA